MTVSGQNGRDDPRRHIRFRFRGRDVDIGGFEPRTTLLDWLRTDRLATGVKEGCNEGDCGACTVVLARRSGDGCVFEAVNACILLLGQVDGEELLTVEDLAASGKAHPVQDALVDHHASQCGFCTPGIVMSLFALCETARGDVSRDAVLDQLAGNLCRCTGYRPIVDAALAASRSEAQAWSAGIDPPGGDLFVGDRDSFFAAPATLDALADLYGANPDATLVSGATDVGLWITKRLTDIRKVIWLGRVAGFADVSDDGGALRLGAGATLASLMPHLGAFHPDLGEILRRFGSAQVRNCATLGGNLANGSPIGDLAPCLIALGATLELRRGDEIRTMPLEDFFLAYGQQDRRPGEVVTAVTVPRLGERDAFRAYKITKRADEDISAVLAAFRFEIVDGRIGSARIAYGGMAATPARARTTEGFILGARPADQATWRGALTALALDFQPLSDQRGSAAYRSLVARNLLVKALTELAGAPPAETRLFAPREVRA